MSDLPEPLTPPDCDLRGMEWMPLHGHRLYGSDFDAIASDTEFRAAQRLWWAAWQQQVPAASLPDDDRVLAHIAGFGRDHKAWAKIREVALHAFVKCADGRIYHRFLASEAVIAWERRIKERDRKAVYRAKRDGTAGGGDVVVPRDMTRTECADDADVPIPSHVDRTGQDSTEKERKKEPLLRNGAADASLQPPIDDDMRLQAWSEGKRVIGKLTGKSPGQCGKLIGLMLRDLNDDCAVLLEIIREADGLRPIDPAAWLVAAVRERKKPKFRNGFLQMIVNEGMSSPDAPVASNPVLEFLEKYENVQH